MARPKLDREPRRTPARSVRVPDDEWEAATRTAAKRGEPLSEVIREALRQYVIRS
jgi:predicted DNA binding CopG/RHH family protein